MNHCDQTFCLPNVDLQGFEVSLKEFLVAKLWFACGANSHRQLAKKELL